MIIKIEDLCDLVSVTINALILDTKIIPDVKLGTSNTIKVYLPTKEIELSISELKSRVYDIVRFVGYIKKKLEE